MVFVPFPSAHLTHDLTKAAAISDATWLETKTALYACPRPLTPAVLVAWPSVLRAFIIDDLRAGRSGDMAHIWKAANCMVVYRLAPSPATLDLMGFHHMDLGTIEKYALVLEGFASAATCIPCSQTEDACYEVRHPPFLMLKLGANRSISYRNILWGQL